MNHRCLWCTNGLVNRAPTVVLSFLGCAQIQCWLISWSRNWLSFCVGRFKPRSFGNLHFFEGLFWCVAEGGAKLQIRDICNISFILLTVENVNMVIFHASPPNEK